MCCLAKCCSTAVNSTANACWLQGLSNSCLPCTCPTHCPVDHGGEGLASAFKSSAIPLPQIFACRKAAMDGTGPRHSLLGRSQRKDRGPFDDSDIQSGNLARLRECRHAGNRGVREDANEIRHLRRGCHI